MALGDPCQGHGDPTNESSGQLVPYQGDPTPMEVNGNGSGVGDPQHGDEQHRPELLLLRQVGSVAAEAARRATLLTVAEWSSRAGQQQNAALRGMGEAVEEQLLAASNQAAALQQHQGRELQALQEGVHGRLATQEGAISVIGAGLEGVRQRA